ncbi:MAG: DUF1800 family protein [Bacteroidetes bacterium]|nr:DUF1800 family protein [Bacteroidota bacterium]
MVLGISCPNLKYICILFEQFEVIRVPPSLPRTKPKACNYGLRFARGEYVVIYDAEDRPQSDQLKKALITFRGAPRNVACVQARLNFYNANENWLTRMFALEYAAWFDFLLTGLDRLGVPIPLGGTSNHFRTEMLRALFNSDFFKSQSSWYTKVKSPVELVAGVLRLTGEFNRPRREIMERYFQAQYMGQWLNNPPSVEGWHQGTDWLDTGTLVERVNFATQQLGDANKPGVQVMIGRITARDERAISPEGLVEACLDQVGALAVSDDTRRELVDFASIGGEVRLGSESPDEGARQRIVEVLQMVASTQEFQRS